MAIQWVPYEVDEFNLKDQAGNSVSLPGQAGMNEIGIAWNKADALMALKVNGTWSADVPYGGVLGDGVLDLFRDHLHKGAVSYLQIGANGTLGQCKSAIDNKEILPNQFVEHKGGTWNEAESKYAFAEIQVGNADGSGDEITMGADHGTIVSSIGSSTLSYSHPKLSMTAGTVGRIEWSDGMIMEVDEGTGINLFDTNDNHIGNVSSSDIDLWWSVKILDPAVVAMDATSQLFTDAAGNRVPLTQDEISAGCGSNKQYYKKQCPNKNLEYWLYKEVLTAEEDAEVKSKACIS